VSSDLLKVKVDNTIVVVVYQPEDGVVELIVITAPETSHEGRGVDVVTTGRKIRRLQLQAADPLCDTYAQHSRR
jgi:hypothetical protein